MAQNIETIKHMVSERYKRGFVTNPQLLRYVKVGVFTMEEAQQLIATTKATTKSTEIKGV